MGLLLEFLFELLIEIFGEILLELGWASVKESLGRANHHPVLAGIGYLMLGGAVGAVGVWLFPERLIWRGGIPGASLILAPLAGGAAMHVWGQYRRGHGHVTTNLATFYGGAAFTFAASLVRFLGTT